MYDVCFVLPSYSYNRPAGGYDVIYELSRRLVNDRYRVIIITPGGNTKYLPHFIESIPEDKIGRLFKLFFPFLESSLFQKFINPALRKLRGIDYDFSILSDVHQKTIRDPINTKLGTKKIIATSWETAYYVEDFLKTHSSDGYYFIQHDESLIGYSGKFSERAKDTYNLHLNKIVTNTPLMQLFQSSNPKYVPIGVNPIILKHKDTKKIPNSILTLFGRGESKGFPYALDALKLLNEKDKGLKLLAFGNVNKELVPEWVEYHYRPSDEELLKLYEDSEIFILPSIVEGVSLVAMEAMAMGCACVITDCGGTSEYTRDGLNCLLVPIRNSEAIVLAVEKLHSDENLRNFISQNGIIYLKKYTYETTYKHFKKAISE